MEDNGSRVGDFTKQVLRSPDFKPTKGVTTEIVALKGTLFTDNDRITKNIRAEAAKRKLASPNAEVACLIRLKFTDEEIKARGLWWIVTMHEPVNDFFSNPCLLCACRDDGASRGLNACRPDCMWSSDVGFAFAVPQV